MKILLLADVDKLGYLGDVVEAKAGYARNYLIPNGLAVVPTEASLRSIAKEKADRAQQRINERDRLQQACAKAQGAEAVLAAKANEQGVLFGSVTAGRIAANLREQGYEVADEVVQLAEHIKHLGTHTVSLKFAEDLEVTVSVVVVREGTEQAVAAKEQTTQAEQVKIKETDIAEEAKQKIIETQQQTEQVQEPTKEKQAETQQKKKKRRWFGRNKE